jgi:hypothetical protein
MNTERYMVDLSTNTIAHFYMPEKYDIRYDTFDKDTSGNIIVNTYSYKTNTLLYQTKGSMSLDCATYSLSDLKKELTIISIPISILLNRCYKINIILNRFMRMYPDIKNNKSRIRIKNYHRVASRQELKVVIDRNEKDKPTSFYLSLESTPPDIQILTQNIVDNILSFLHDTIEYLIRIQSVENCVWIKDDSIDAYLDALYKTYIRENNGRYSKEYLVYSFSNDNFFYYSKYYNKYFKTKYIRICVCKKDGWTLHFDTDNMNRIEIDIDKLFTYYDIMKRINKG